MERGDDEWWANALSGESGPVVYSEYLARIEYLERMVALLEPPANKQMQNVRDHMVQINECPSCHYRWPKD